MSVTPEFKALQSAAHAKLCAIAEQERDRPLRGEEKLDIYRSKIIGLDSLELYKIAPDFTPDGTTATKPRISESEASAWVNEHRSFLSPAARMAAVREIVKNGAFPAADAPRPSRTEERERQRSQWAAAFSAERSAYAEKFK